jgi:hypothetical protein
MAELSIPYMLVARLGVVELPMAIPEETVVMLPWFRIDSDS